MYVDGVENFRGKFEYLQHNHNKQTVYVLS